MRAPGSSTLTPELSVRNISASRRFYCDILGFTMLYDRPEEGFACIEYDGCRLMLDALGIGRDFVTGPMEHPFGRGVNLEFVVADLGPLLARLDAAGIDLFLPLETRNYRIGDDVITQRQFGVQDPDGYLIRFAQSG